LVFDRKIFGLVKLKEVKITNGAGLMLRIEAGLVTGMFIVRLFAAMPIVCRDQDKTEGRKDNAKDKLV
jgi:hypothetical protein